MMPHSIFFTEAWTRVLLCGQIRRDRPEECKTESPGRKDFRRHAPLRSCTKPRRVWPTAADISSMAGIQETYNAVSLGQKAHQIRAALGPTRAGFCDTQSRPIQPHKVGETNSCLRHRRGSSIPWLLRAGQTGRRSRRLIPSERSGGTRLR